MGTEAEFQGMINTCHTAGMRIYQNGYCNVHSCARFHL